MVAPDLDGASRTHANDIVVGIIVNGDLQGRAQFFNKGLSVTRYLFDPCHGQGAILAVDNDKISFTVTTHEQTHTCHTFLHQHTHIRPKNNNDSPHLGIHGQESHGILGFILGPRHGKGIVG